MATFPVKRQKDAMTEQINYKQELERAYRALFAYAKAIARKEPLGEAACAYHSLTIAAAVRFVLDSELDGSGYFEGKHVEILHETLHRLRS